MRVCFTCHEAKDLSEFYRGICYKDGYDIYCKPCARARRLSNDRNPKGNRHSKRSESDTVYWCPKCKTYKDKSSFYIETTHRSPSRYSTYCIDCENKRKGDYSCLKQRRAKYAYNVKCNIVKVLSERARKLDVWRRLKDTPKWRASKSKTAHNRRCAVRNTVVAITGDDILFLLSLQNNRCACCNREFSSSLKYELDHIKPVSKGGDLVLNNVQLLCKSCNCSKGSKMIKYRNDMNSISEVING